MISIDGKSLCGSRDKDKKRIVHMVSAWAGVNNIVLGQLNEDNSRKRAGHAAQNFSVLNRIALNLLKNETSSKRGIKGKRLKAAWSNVYLEKVLKI